MKIITINDKKFLFVDINEYGLTTNDVRFGNFKTKTDEEKEISKIKWKPYNFIRFLDNEQKEAMAEKSLYENLYLDHCVVGCGFERFICKTPDDSLKSLLRRYMISDFSHVFVEDGRNIELKMGKLIYFAGHRLPMKIVGMNDRYVVAIRKLNRRQDASLLWHEVDMHAFSTFTQAYESYKNDPVYTILDTEEKIRAPHNLIMGGYDMGNYDEIKQLLEDLNSGETQLSHRNRIGYEIDVNRTKM